LFVMASVLETASYLVELNVVSFTNELRMVRLVRFIRLVRAVRGARIIRLIRVLRNIFNQLVTTMKPLIWAILLLLMIIYIFAVLFTQACTAHRQDNDSSDLVTTTGSGDQHADPDVLDFDPNMGMLRYWATLPRSMFSLYMAITGGISWIELIMPLSNFGWGYVAIFISYITLVEFAVLNVLTGVFCQIAIDSAQHDPHLISQTMAEQREATIARIEDVFKLVDTDKNDNISIQEFQTALEDPTIRGTFESLDLDTSDVWTVFNLLDRDNGALIDLDEFVHGILCLRGGAKGLELLLLDRGPQGALGLLPPLQLRQGGLG